MLPLFLISCGTVVIPDSTTCFPNGKLSAGGTCSHSEEAGTFTLTFNEILDLLDAQPYDRMCVPVPGLKVCQENPAPGAVIEKIEKRGASAIIEVDQYVAVKTALETACRLLRRNCTYEIKAAIKMMVAPPKASLVE